MRKVIRIEDVEKLLGAESAARLAEGIDKLKARPRRGPIPFVVTTRWVFTASQEIAALTSYEAIDKAGEDITQIAEDLKGFWRGHALGDAGERVFDSPGMRDGFIIPASVTAGRRFKIERKPKPKVSIRVETGPINTGVMTDKTTTQGGPLRVQRRRSRS